MLQKVSDTRANLNENIVHAAKIIGRSAHRRAVFSVIYTGRNKYWTATEISKRTKLKRVRVLQEGGKLAGNEIVQQQKIDGDIAYSKDKQLAHHKAKILRLAGNAKAQARIPTKQTPHGHSTTAVRISVRASTPKPKKITIDDVASFADVRTIDGTVRGLRLDKLREDRIRSAFKRILGETHDFKDWGGEKNDLYTNKLRLKSTRSTAAFAFKGRATTGTLTPKKMGKNGDQIGRLFAGDAEVFFVVYHGKVDESIVSQMHAFALGKSMGGRAVSYGTIDGDDLNRLHQAYPQHFKR
jgi:hypothetical protein